MILLQNPQPRSHLHICPKPKVKLGPTDLIYLTPPSSVDIATAKNPRQFGLTIWISGSPRWHCKLSISLRNVSVSSKWAIGPTEFALQTLCFPFVTFWSHRSLLSVRPKHYERETESLHCELGGTDRSFQWDRNITKGNREFAVPSRWDQNPYRWDRTD